MKLAAYTFITNHKGGVYVRQVTAQNVVQACRVWASEMIKLKDIEDLDIDRFLKSFNNDIEDLPPVALQNTPNVWGFSVGSGRNFMLINIVKTDAKSVETPLSTERTQAA